MDLDAAKTADLRSVRLARAGMVCCFFVASVMLLTSLAFAKGITPPFDGNSFTSLTTLH